MTSKSSVTCDVPDQLGTDFAQFRLDKSNINKGMIYKINKEKLIVEVEQELDCPFGDIAWELPDSAPRFVAYSYKYEHEDKRVSFPLVFIFYCPQDLNPTLNMLYTSTKQRLQDKLQIAKCWDVQESETLTEEWLKEKLKFFK